MKNQGLAVYTPMQKQSALVMLAPIAFASLSQVLNLNTNNAESLS
jgi:hypothetical protein